MFNHEDRLSEIGQNATLGKKIGLVHKTLKVRFPFISRIAATLYDAKTGTLSTFIHNSDEISPLINYQAKLADAPSLMEILEKGRPRVVNDLAIFNEGVHEHTQRIKSQGNISSYTMPMYNHGVFFGFLFFNSDETAPFTETVLEQLDPYGHLIALTIIADISLLQTLFATVKTARDMAHLRDDETGAHQDRMSRYARLIALRMGPQYGFTDEYIENVFIFAPLHDIGKMGVPDQILLKPGMLTEEEFIQMKSHTVRGRQLIDQMVENFELNGVPHIEVMRNIAEFHHEAMDGSGYPDGRKGDEIPIEARIVAVADIFDALTSQRPYKEAWSNDEAFAMIRQLSGLKLDTDCVNAFIGARTEVEDIQRQFKESILG